MRFDPNKDLYLILGVSANATNVEIVKAFKARTRILHPDRFDRKTQSAEWSQANEMQTDLNIAFQILREAHSRDLYDEFRGLGKKSTPSSSAFSRNTTRSSKGQARTTIAPYTEISFKELSERTKKKILERQNARSADQVRISTAPIAGICIRIVISLSILGVLYSQTKVSNSWQDSWVFYLGFMWVGVYLGLRGARNLHKYYKVQLSPNYYLTPLYFIKTEYDFLWIWPLTGIEQVSFRDHYYNGISTGKTVSFQFKNGSPKIEFKTFTQGDEITSKYNKYVENWNSALEQADAEYFVLNNDFSEIPTESRTSQKPPSNKRGATYLIAFLLGMFLFAIGYLLNTDYTQKNPKPFTSNNYNLNRPSKTSYAKKQKVRPSIPVPSYPEVNLPPNGEVVRFASNNPKARFKIDNLRGDHTLIKLVNTYTGVAVMTIFVHSGANAETKVPIGNYEVRYAAGEKWYGDNHLFGPGTAYSKADENFQFYEEPTADGSIIHGCSITLYKVVNGNLSTSTIDSSQF
jgi:hypothetical protein